jgi:hypothetical protein
VIVTTGLRRAMTSTTSSHAMAMANFGDVNGI